MTDSTIKIEDIVDFLSRKTEEFIKEARSERAIRYEKLKGLLIELIDEAERSDRNLQDICGGMFIQLCSNLGPGVKEEVERTSSAQAEIFSKIRSVIDERDISNMISEFSDSIEESFGHSNATEQSGNDLVAGFVERFGRNLDGSASEQDDISMRSIPGVSEEVYDKLRSLGVSTVREFKAGVFDLIDKFSDEEYEEIISSIVRFGIDFDGIELP